MWLINSYSSYAKDIRGQVNSSSALVDTNLQVNGSATINPTKILRTNSNLLAYISPANRYIKLETTQVDTYAN